MNTTAQHPLTYEVRSSPGERDGDLSLIHVRQAPYQHADAVAVFARGWEQSRLLARQRLIAAVLSRGLMPAEGPVPSDVVPLGTGRLAGQFGTVSPGLFLGKDGSTLHAVQAASDYSGTAASHSVMPLKPVQRDELLQVLAAGPALHEIHPQGAKPPLSANKEAVQALMQAYGTPALPPATQADGWARLSRSAERDGRLVLLEASAFSKAGVEVDLLQVRGLNTAVLRRLVERDMNEDQVQAFRRVDRGMQLATVDSKDPERVTARLYSQVGTDVKVQQVGPWQDADALLAKVFQQGDTVLGLERARTLAEPESTRAVNRGR